MPFPARLANRRVGERILRMSPDSSCVSPPQQRERNTTRFGTPKAQCLYRSGRANDATDSGARSRARRREPDMRGSDHRETQPAVSLGTHIGATSDGAASARRSPQWPCRWGSKTPSCGKDGRARRRLVIRLLSREWRWHRPRGSQSRRLARARRIPTCEPGPATARFHRPRPSRSPAPAARSRGRTTVMPIEPRAGECPGLPLAVSGTPSAAGAATAPGSPPGPPEPVPDRPTR